MTREGCKRAFDRLVVEAPCDWGPAWSDEAWKQPQPLFAELRRLSALHHVALRIVAIPVRHQVTARPPDGWPQRRLKGVASQFGIPVLDLLPVLRRAQQARPDSLFLDHCHPAADASDVIATAILEILRDPSPSPEPVAPVQVGGAASR